MGSVLWGLGIMLFGALMTVKARSMQGIFGKVNWAEANLRGGTAQFYKLLGILISVIGILIATSLIQGLVLKLLSPLFGGLA